ncbi:sugar phosphate isomerase/epimerase [Maribellus sp. YY47]|uniref:sugar phosphate isomerase/epimerase family protein n=1 Tax=Maribellus sp. YY47 TaxID=2929486 RepID=UPI0020011A54|nr:sugar phosphate isomerase/epimerase [Maribellus sp. YY47]MCK3683769.1 sugar phosphate isomerase/epimerase [Maribellus sp. YY47]
MKKREFLKSLGLLTAGGVVSSAVNPASAASLMSSPAAKKQIGLQLYSLGKELTDDVPEGLKKVAKIGYTNAEAAGYRDRKMYGLDVTEIKKMADDAGLKMSGSHVNPPVRKYSKDNKAEIADFWKAAVEDHAKLGVTTLVQPGMPQVETESDVALVAEIFNNAGEAAKAAGIKWGYHNHSHEFERVSKDGDNSKKGGVFYDMVLNGTDPSLVFFEMDVYWTVMGQCDPLEYFAKYPGRFPVLHIKDRKVLGQSGMMNFENIFTKAYENGLDEFFVELEGIRNGMTQFEGVKECFDYLNKAKFVK